MLAAGEFAAASMLAAGEFVAGFAAESVAEYTAEFAVVEEDKHGPVVAHQTRI
jgi:hypothetical protein